MTADFRLFRLSRFPSPRDQFGLVDRLRRPKNAAPLRIAIFACYWRCYEHDGLLDLQWGNAETVSHLLNHAFNVEFRQRLVRQHAPRIEHDRGKRIVGHQAGANQRRRSHRRIGGENLRVREPGDCANNQASSEQAAF